MELVKSKDAAESLNVSQTTVKRWASHFPHYFQKDRFGHYVFSSRDLSMLAYIKESLERGETMDMIVLPEPEQQPEHPLVSAVEASHSLLFGNNEQVAAASETYNSEIHCRLVQVERRLEQKADEVVAAQILQHRSELEELRKMIDHLSAAIEYAKQPIPPLSIPAYAAETAAAIESPVAVPSPARKRGLFRSLFVWF
ncbi:MerR family transcriptional regulator [Paenibacillus sp. BC26]|uniref:MerR family transcriptional regulator n=1 Tax=Paenibacillus sp. BC26 TaxID=1881032 RepID=UPI0008E60708|nr:MerR family transcriptional regulator [Paenibacillus sp. BC26]SFT21172.1 chromosome-anchoring protein RacA [Paenibacillus sp. BC26]